MLPKIGITCRYHYVESQQYPFTGVRTSYVDAIISAGALPILIPLTESGLWLDQLYAEVSGLLIPGGEDVNPARYGETAHPKLGKTCDQRDKMEIDLICRARKDKKPLLGICRGLQIINVALGGTLYQDIPSQAPSSVAHPENPTDASWNSPAHQIEIQNDSRLYQILNRERVVVNSLHHQGVKALAPDLRAVAYADDTLIEAFEASDAHFLLAMQCHPETLCFERANTQIVDTQWLRVFEAFVNEARSYSERVS